jgi:Poly(A) RNA polymerase, mitochondrial-like, central palm domain
MLCCLPHCGCLSFVVCVALAKRVDLEMITSILQGLLKKQRPSTAQKEQRDEALREITKVISQAFPRGKVHPFGSTACQTDLQSSDTDVVVLANGIPSKVGHDGDSVCVCVCVCCSVCTWYVCSVCAYSVCVCVCVCVCVRVCVVCVRSVCA